MQIQFTITNDEDVYEGLHRIMDESEISGFIEALVRPHVLGASNLEHVIVELIAMSEDCNISFEPPRLDTEIYRKSEAL